ncbi:MAG: glycosyltransferase family 4 protein [Candidatus Yanofskybacteria bacterium]|nr:glycosyltransferase family 4 protein [Candidatus Yanofskybacteria bacterium]
MKHLVIITQKVDQEDDILGFFVDWIREFSKQFNQVSVITLGKGTYQLPHNVSVYSLGKEENTSSMVRLFRLYKYLFKLIPHSDGVFAHMSPIFVVLSWPVATLYRKRIVLWYLHRSVTTRLKIANLMAYKIVTSTNKSLGFQSNKIIETGHAINTDYFKPDEQKRSNFHDPVRILHVARISPAKKLETLIDAAKIIRDQGIACKISFIGKPVMPGDFEYLKFLQDRIQEYSLQENFDFIGFIPYSKMADYYRQFDIAVNLTNGGTDKVVLESMATGCITITSNPAFSQYLGVYSKDLLFEYCNAQDLAEHVKKVIDVSPEQKKQIAQSLRESVMHYHLLSKTIANISDLF